MKIRLIAPDSVIPNYAIMKISTYHKNIGDDVGWYDPEKDIFDTDKLYISKVFKFSTTSIEMPMNADCEIEWGGTGIDIRKELPPEVEECELDWSLYPDCDYSIVFTTRGCVRHCPFCIVNEKEGLIHDVPIPNLNPNGRKIKVFDNNFFASRTWRERLDKLRALNQRLDFSGGIDLRLLTEEMCEELGKCRIESVKVAWDNYEDRDIILPKVRMLIRYVRPYKVICYVLVGYKSRELTFEDTERVRELWDMRVYPYIMVYQDFNDPNYVKPRILNKYARWCNNRFVFKKCTWEEYNYK